MYKKNKIGLIVTLGICFSSNLIAGDLVNYAVGDVLVCFRKSGVANDMVVDAGPVATFTNAVKNQRIPISQYTGSQLGVIGTNSVTWSAWTWLDASVSPASIQETLFVTRARSSINTQTTPWLQKSQGVQAGIDTDMSTIMVGAVDRRYNNVKSTDTAVIEPDDSSTYLNGTSYSTTIGLYGSVADGILGGNFSGDFQGNVENTTSASFTTGGTVTRSDFYQIPPVGGGSVRFLGFYEFSTNGSMTYVAYPTAPTVATVAASAVAATGAQLNAAVTTINTNTDNTSFYFQYGLTASYGSVTTVSNLGTNSGNYGLSVSSLTAGTAYHFRAAAYNQYGTNFGSDLTFTTSGGSPAIPVIKNIGRTNNITYVSFTTGSNGTYTLRGTNNLAINRTNWPVVSSIAGNGLTNTLQDTTSDSGKFYIITAQ